MISLIKSLLQLQLVCLLVVAGHPDVTRNSDKEIQTSTTPRSSRLPEGYVVYSEDHAAYKIHLQTWCSWYEARDECTAEGAHLPITDSQDKVARILQLVNDLGADAWIPNISDAWVPVGIYKSGATNEWVRIDNDLPVTSLPWGTGEPAGNGNCAVSWKRGGVNETLVDHNCLWKFSYFICQIPITANNSE